MPAKDEANTLEDSISSVIAQTITPTAMIVVDDCSIDDTPNIIKSFLSKVSWLRMLRHDVPGPRMPGPRVVEAFNYGLERLTTKDYKFVVKMDADIVLEPTYFNRLLSRFEECQTLGIAGGVTYVRRRGRWVREIRTAVQVQGNVKTYRRTCFEDIGGLLPMYGWDTIDCVRARMRGWKAHSFEDMAMHHHRLMGSATGLFRTRVRMGKVQYYLGYHLLYVLAGAILKLCEPPCGITSLGVLWGFFTSLVRRRERFNDPQFIQFLRAEQMRRLTLGRVAAKYSSFG